MRAVRFNRSLFLRFMLTATFESNLVKGASKQVIVAACLHRKSRFVVWVIHEAFANVELTSLPGSQTLRNLFRKLCGVSGGVKGNRRQVAGELVMSMPVRRRAGEARDNHERAIHANYSHHVA